MLVSKNFASWWRRVLHGGLSASRSVNAVKPGATEWSQMMKWTDSLDVAIALSEAHPEVDPSKINFVDLMQWVIALPDFTEDERHCGEKKLEAIQQAWMDELE